MAAAIDHPNVIPVHAAGEEDGRLYLVMRYVRGTDLHALLAARGPPRRRAAPRRSSPRSRPRSTPRTAPGSSTATSSRPTCSSAAPPGAEHVYLSDFGLTRVAGSGRAADRVPASGSARVDFMSPEHLRGERTDARSDVYALGCVLCAALTGGAPFPRGTVPGDAARPPPRRARRCPSDTRGRPGRVRPRARCARWPRTPPTATRRPATSAAPRWPPPAGSTSPRSSAASPAARPRRPTAAVGRPPARETNGNGHAPAATDGAAAGDDPPRAARRRAADPRPGRPVAGRRSARRS